MKTEENTLGHLLRRLLKSHPAFASNPIGDWKDLAGEQTAQYSQPRSLKNKILMVVVHDSVWKHHLELLKGAILHKINSGKPQPLVTDIVFRVGEVPASMPILNPNHNQLNKIKMKNPHKIRQQKVPRRKLTPDEEALIASLPDSRLRKIGKRLLAKTSTEDHRNGYQNSPPERCRCKES